MTLSRRQRAVIVLTLYLALLLALGYGFSLVLPREAAAPRLAVVASFFPVAEFVRPLVGDDVSVVTLVPPGSEPHDWEPTPGDMTLLARADLVVYIHPDFESYVPRLLEGLADRPREVVLSRGLDLIKVQRGAVEEIDPHIWLDPVLVQHQVDLIRDALTEVDPARALEYGERAAVLKEELRRLHMEIVSGLRRCELRTFIASHAAFTYFALRYNLTLMPISLDPEVAPGPAGLEELVEFARENNITVIFTEPMVSGGAAEAIAEEIGGITLPLDPVEGLTARPEDGPTYFTIMRDNLRNLRIGLRCGE